MRKHKKRLPHEVEKLKARCAGMASTTKGRKTRFTNRKRKANKEACRGDASPFKW